MYASPAHHLLASSLVTLQTHLHYNTIAYPLGALLFDATKAHLQGMQLAQPAPLPIQVTIAPFDPHALFTSNMRDSSPSHASFMIQDPQAPPLAEVGLI